MKWCCVLGQVEASVVDEPQVVVFKGSFKLAPEPRGVARSAALAAAEMVLVSPLISVWPHRLHVLYTSTTRIISAFVPVWHHSSLASLSACTVHKQNSGS